MHHLEIVEFKEKHVQNFLKGLKFDKVKSLLLTVNQRCLYHKAGLLRQHNPPLKIISVVYGEFDVELFRIQMK